MKVVCDRGALLDAVNLVSGAVATRTPRPQLTCVKLSAEKQGKGAVLSLSATDGELSLHLTVDQVDVQEPGAALIPADKLRQIVSAESNEPTLTLESTGDKTEIRGEDAHFVVYGFPPEDFPTLTDFKAAVAGQAGTAPAKAVFSHDTKTLADMIAKTLFATARETTRYSINGVLLNRQGNKLEMVATDGRRLALCRSTLSEKEDEGLRCIVPTKALSQLAKLLAGTQGKVGIAITENQVFFGLESEDGTDIAVLSSILVEGTFPPYEDVIPKDNDKMVNFDRDSMLSAVKRAALLTNEESRGVRMAFTASDKRLDISSRAPEMGEANIQIDLREYKGDDIEIGFNPAFLIDALKVVDEPDVIMEVKAPNKPGLIRVGHDFLYVVMPVNLS